MKILLVVGSLSHDSLHLKLSKEIKTYLESNNHEVSYLDYKYIPYFNRDILSPLPEYIRRVRDDINSSDGMIILTPTYNHTLPAVIKNLIDWLSVIDIDTKIKVLNITITTDTESKTLSRLENLLNGISVCNVDGLLFKSSAIDTTELYKKIDAFIQ